MTIEDVFDTLFELIGTDIGQKAQTPHIDTDDGCRGSSYHAGCAQQRTVTTHGNGVVVGLLIAVEHMGERRLDACCVLQELEILTIYMNLCLVLFQAREHFLDAGRFLGLVAVAEQGND